ncbi:MAG: transposase, partial [Lachnospiraceae bacterium]|nr:transposase [Lachnospiraceae bacterium]
TIDMVYHRSVSLSYHTQLKPRKGFSAMSGNMIQLSEDLIKNIHKDLFRNCEEETLVALLEHEADEYVKADRYKRTGSRQGYRSGHYDRNFTTTSRRRDKICPSNDPSAQPPSLLRSRHSMRV